MAMAKRLSSRADWLTRGGVFWGGHLHEPLYFYKLMGERRARQDWMRGRQLAGVDMTAPWLDQWYDLCRSAATLDELAKAGVNCLYLNWFKGFGLRYEAAEQARIARVIQQCKDRGIRTTLYIQPSNFIEHALRDECADAPNWRARNANGEPIMYGGVDFRPLACVQHPAWRDVVVQAAASGAKAGADGIFLDNLNHNECCCELTQEAYRAFTGDPSADLIAEAGTGSAIAFRVQTTMELVAAVTDAIRAINPQCAVMSNPAWPRAATMLTTGVDIIRLARHIDVVMFENKCFPRVEDGRVIGSSYGYRVTEATGALGVPSPWMPDMSLPECPSAIRRQLCEPLVFGGHIMCGPWALRPLGDDRCTRRYGPEQLYLRHANVGATYAECMTFGRSVSALFTDATPWARVGLLHATEAFAADHAAAMAATLTADGALMAAHIPHRVVLSDEGLDRQSLDVVVVPSPDALSKDTRDALRRFADEGGDVVELPAEHVGPLAPDPSVAISDGAVAWITTIAQTHAGTKPYHIDAPAGVVSFPLQTAAGYLIGLLSYGEDRVEAATLTIDPKRWPVKQLRMRSLNGGDAAVTGGRVGGAMVFTLPAWETCALCELLA